MCPRRNEQAEAFLAAFHEHIFYGVCRRRAATYSPAYDFLYIPRWFRRLPDFYAIALHELVHWTGHPSRLNRNFGSKDKDDEGHAMEEIVAELGAILLCRDLGIGFDIEAGQARRIAAWLIVAKSRRHPFATAALHARQAAAFLRKSARTPAPQQTMTLLESSYTKPCS